MAKIGVKTGRIKLANSFASVFSDINKIIGRTNGTSSMVFNSSATNGNIFQINNF